MRIGLGGMVGVACWLVGCTTVDSDINANSIPTAVRTRIAFIPPDRVEAQRYLDIEKHVYKTNTEPMKERLAALERGREERYRQVRGEFPDCLRQKHCESKLGRGDVKRFERYSDLAKEIHEYDMLIVELQATLRDWDYRLQLRERAIINRFIVHQLLDIPQIDNRYQNILVHSLESFETRKQASLHLMRYAGDTVVPTVLGDLDFKMLGRPVDEAAVIATFEVYLMPRVGFPMAPTRYVISFLVNTYQLDLRYYEQDYLKAWTMKLAEPFQKELREDIYCGLYAIASDFLAAKLPLDRAKPCLLLRNEMQTRQADRFVDRFGPERWLLPLAYFIMARPAYK